MSVNIFTEEFESQHVILTGMHGMKYKELLNMIKEILGNRIKIEYRERKSETHYQVTPYSFNPKLGKKLICNPYVDMGQGLLSCMKEVYEKLHKEKHEEMGLLVDEENNK